MIQQLKALERRLRPLLGLLMVIALLTLFIPVSHALWTSTLGVSGTVRLGAATPTPSATLTPSATPEANGCTFRQGYWKNHPEAWPVDALELGGVTYTQAEAMAILDNMPRGDATYILAHQLIAAKLNIAGGADSNAVATTVLEADAFLSLHHLGSDPKNPDRARGVALSETLEQYNEGRIGPGHCEDDDFVPTSTATATPSLEATETPEATAPPSPQPSPTLTPTDTATASPEPTETPTGTATPSPEAVEAPTGTASPSPEPSATSTDTVTPTSADTPTS